MAVCLDYVDVMCQHVCMCVCAGVGRATCERLLSCLTLMSAPNSLTVDTAPVESDGALSSVAFPWLGAAANAPVLVRLASGLVDILSAAKGTEEEPCKVKNYDKLLRDAARLLYNASTLLLRAPLRLKQSAEQSVSLSGRGRGLQRANHVLCMQKRVCMSGFRWQNMCMNNWGWVQHR